MVVLLLQLNCFCVFVKPENPSNNMNIFKRTFRPPVSPWDHHHKRDKDHVVRNCFCFFFGTGVFYFFKVCWKI